MPVIAWVSELCIPCRTGRALPVVIQGPLPDQGTRNPVDLFIRERVTIMPGHAVAGTGPRPAREQTKQPGYQHVAMVDDLIAGAL
jgi:hypothetical protein